MLLNVIMRLLYEIKKDIYTFIQTILTFFYFQVTIHTGVLTDNNNV